MDYRLDWKGRAVPVGSTGSEVFYAPGGGPWSTDRKYGYQPGGGYAFPPAVVTPPVRAPVPANAPEESGGIMDTLKSLELWHWAAIAAVAYFLFMRKGR